MRNEGNRSWASTVGRRSFTGGLFCALVIFVAAIVIYQSNGDTYLYAYDSAPNSLLAFNAIDHHRLDFDNFRGSYFDSLGANYIFVNGWDGKLVSLFPVGTAILSAPLYLAFDAERRVLHQPLDITQPAFERYRLHYEKQAANAIAALAAALMFLCARRFGGTMLQAWVVTIFFAFGTEMWVVGSQALWQHGPLNLVIIATIYALLAASEAHDVTTRNRWLLAAGVCAGFLPVVRPTAVLFLSAATIAAGWYFGPQIWIFCCGVLLGIAPGVVWNYYFFHSLIGGYLGNTNNYVYSLQFAKNALAGLLVSPSKGLFITTPLIIFSIVGLVRAGGMNTAAARILGLMSLAAAALVGTYAFYADWWGGTNFGDRFLSDTSAVSALLLIFVLPRDPMSFARSSVRSALLCLVFCTLFGLCIGIQFVGANGEMESEWSGVPFNVDSHTERLWNWKDTQIERDARATYWKFAQAATYSPSYPAGSLSDLTGFNALLGTIGVAGSPISEKMQVAAARPFDLGATVDNRGNSALYGYETGCWIGQARVHVRIKNPAGLVVSEGLLYLRGFLAPHTMGEAFGTVVAPSAAGDYTMELDVFANRLDLKRSASPLVVSLGVR